METLGLAGENIELRAETWNCPPSGVKDRKASEERLARFWINQKNKLPDSGQRIGRNCDTIS
jgi:hypothetical protein